MTSDAKAVADSDTGQGRPLPHPLPDVPVGVTENAIVDVGWGRLIFAQTFADNEALANCIRDEQPGRRDVALYLRDPHVVISLAPQELFLDPSHTYRLWLERYQPRTSPIKGLAIRELTSLEEAEQVNRIYAARHMVQPLNTFFTGAQDSQVLDVLIAVDSTTDRVIGAITGVDHKAAFQDPENGTSLWALAVDPQTPLPGVGEALVRALAERYKQLGRVCLDLSVMHDNTQAIALYEKLGFERVPVFCVKNKNSINEPLFIGPEPETSLNPYAKIIIKEARRRGIQVEVLDEEAAYFALTFGGRTIVCRESLSEMTTAIAMSRCDDKAVTRRLLARAGLSVPAQMAAGDKYRDETFLSEQDSVVVKPARGEQGVGISVDIRTPYELSQAVTHARQFCETVLLESFVKGDDLRLIVIDYKLVAAAIRKPAQITGDGHHSVRELIDKQSRRRAAATGGESRIPFDSETERCVQESGYAYTDVPPLGEEIAVRKTANLHTGGTIHDVTDYVSYTLVDAAIRAAQAIDIPVVGLDFIVPSIRGKAYWIIEANERPGLANHEPQPTAERFVDLLFPQTKTGLPVEGSIDDPAFGYRS